MKRLRDAPISRGKPNSRSSSSRASTVMLCSGVLPKPMPGSSTIWLPGMPARAAMSSERAKNASISRMISMAGSARSRLCITMTAALCSATTLAMSGSRCRPQTSLAIAAPAPSAHATTADFMLSMETGVPRATTSPKHRAQPLQLFLGGHRLRAIGPGGLRADVDDVGTLGDHAAGLRQRALRRDELSAVGKGIRRDIEHAHHRRIRAATAARAVPDDPPGQVWRWSRSCGRFARSEHRSQVLAWMRRVGKAA